MTQSIQVWFFLFSIVAFIAIVLVGTLVVAKDDTTSEDRVESKQVVKPREIPKEIIPVDNLQPGLSFLIRAKNEADNVEYCLGSLCALYGNNSLVEIIYVDNQSTDNTPALVQQYADKYDNVFLYHYDKPLARVGQEHIDAYYHRNEKSTITDYYNWTLDKATRYNVIKWDADFLAHPHSLKHMIERHHLLTREDPFSLWFAGRTLFQAPNNDWYEHEAGFYNEFRCFSKKHGFRWEDAVSHEKKLHPVWESAHGLFHKTYCDESQDPLYGYKYNPYSVVCGLGCEVYIPVVFYELKRCSKDEFNGRDLLDGRDKIDHDILQSLKNGTQPYANIQKFQLPKYK